MSFPGRVVSRTSASRGEQVLAGAPAMVVDESRGASASPRGDRRRRSRRARPRAPRAARDCCSTAPMTRRRCTQCRRALCADQRVARGGVDRVVEGDVGLDHRRDVAAARGAPAGVDQRRVERRRGAAAAQPGGERVERAAHLVDLGDPGGVERRDERRRGRARRRRGRPSSAGAAPAAPAGATPPAARRCLPASAARRARASRR